MFRQGIMPLCWWLLLGLLGSIGPVLAQSGPADAAPHIRLAPAVSFEGGDGLSLDQAVVIKTTGGEMAGVGAEYQWLRQRYPGYKRISQALIDQGASKFDDLEIEMPDGRHLHIFFDISDFFGKY